MAKVKSKWICQECGYESAGYLGKCPSCNSWGTFVEEVQAAITPQALTPQGFVNEAKPSLLSTYILGKKSELVQIFLNLTEFWAEDSFRVHLF